MLTILTIAYTIATTGWWGETKVRLALRTLPKEYKAVHNVYVRDSRGITQIDHVLFSPYGIFAIETKNLAGVVFGGADARLWVHLHAHKQYDMYNPFRQNRRHVRALEEVLGLPQGTVRSAVAFVGPAQINLAGGPDGIAARGALTLVRKIKNVHELRHSPEEAEALRRKLLAVRLPDSQAVRAAHLAQVAKESRG